MQFRSKLNPQQWAEARRLRQSGVSVSEIARRFEVSRQTIGARARNEGWLRPGQAFPDPLPGKVRLVQTGFPVRRALARRMFRILNIELTLVELRMLKRLEQAQSNPSAPVETSEPDLRHAQSVMKAVAEITEQDTDTDPGSGANAGGKSRSAADASAASEEDAFRREIAERIEKLIPSP